jgi:ribosomal RNA-processing protein 12
LVNSASETEHFGDAEHKVEYFPLEQSAVKLLPTMFKFITETHASVSKIIKSSNENEDAMDTDEKSIPSSSDNSMATYQQLQHVTEAISSLAKFAPTDFVQGMFKKVMHRLLEEIQSDTCDNEKVCSLLSLSQALVASEVLDETNISFLCRVLKAIIKDDENGPRVQKRSYKLLAEICQRYHSYVTQPDQLTDFIQLLTSTIMTSQISARHMRLKCMNTMVEGMEYSDSRQMVSGQS